MKLDSDRSAIRAFALSAAYTNPQGFVYVRPCCGPSFRLVISFGASTEEGPESETLSLFIQARLVMIVFFSLRSSLLLLISIREEEKIA